MTDPHSDHKYQRILASLAKSEAMESDMITRDLDTYFGIKFGTEQAKTVKQFFSELGLPLPKAGESFSTRANITPSNNGALVFYNDPPITIRIEPEGLKAAERQDGTSINHPAILQPLIKFKRNGLVFEICPGIYPLSHFYTPPESNDPIIPPPAKIEPILRSITTPYLSQLIPPLLEASSILKGAETEVQASAAFDILDKFVSDCMPYRSTFNKIYEEDKVTNDILLPLWSEFCVQYHLANDRNATWQTKPLDISNHLNNFIHDCAADWIVKKIADMTKEPIQNAQKRIDHTTRFLDTHEPILRSIADRKDRGFILANSDYTAHQFLVFGSQKYNMRYVEGELLNKKLVREIPQLTAEQAGALQALFESHGLFVEHQDKRVPTHQSKDIPHKTYLEIAAQMHEIAWMQDQTLLTWGWLDRDGLAFWDWHLGNTGCLPNGDVVVLDRESVLEKADPRFHSGDMDYFGVHVDFEKRFHEANDRILGFGSARNHSQTDIDAIDTEERGWRQQHLYTPLRRALLLSFPLSDDEFAAQLAEHPELFTEAEKSLPPAQLREEAGSNMDHFWDFAQRTYQAHQGTELPALLRSRLTISNYL